MKKTGRKVYIVGGQAGAKIAFDIVTQCGDEVLGFIDNFVKPGQWSGIEPLVLGSLDSPENMALLRQESVDYFVATGDNRVREQTTDKIVSQTGKLPINAIHPAANISRFASLGAGNLVCAGAVINFGAVVGSGAIINSGAVVEHDNFVEDYSQISPNASLAGYVSVGKRAFVGTGAVVIPHVKIGANAIVGAGAVVIRDVQEATLVVGVPATKKRQLDISGEN